MDDPRQDSDPALDFMRANQVATFLAFFIAVGVLLTIRFPGPGSALVTGAAAVVVIWYTVETARIRKQGDDEARRRRTPVLKFVVTFPEGSDKDLKMAVRVRNHSNRRAIIRVTVRARVPERTVQFPDGAYSGEANWEIWAFESWRTFPPLRTIVGDSLPLTLAQHAAHGPVVTIAVEFQAAVYNSKGDFQYLFRREYHVDVQGEAKYRDGGFELTHMETTGFKHGWPEIAVQSFPKPALYPVALDVATLGESSELL
jgi:hypothetical protein